VTRAHLSLAAIVDEHYALSISSLFITFIDSMLGVFQIKRVKQQVYW
jgi:hypothetical protein